MTAPDPRQYKEEVRQGYDDAAVAWQKWWKTIERGTETVSKRFVELAEVKPGSRALDIATGIGEPALTAAKQAGKSGHILAIDISTQMLFSQDKPGAYRWFDLRMLFDKVTGVIFLSTNNFTL